MSIFDNLYDAAKDFVNKDFVSEEVQEQRLNICKACEHYWELTSQCSKCGCIMPIKTKLAHSKCPDDPERW